MSHLLHEAHEQDYQELCDCDYKQGKQDSRTDAEYPLDRFFKNEIHDV